MQRVIIKHMNGSRAGVVDEFILKDISELSFGRDPSSAVKYDATVDTLVSTRHAVIRKEPQDEFQFLLIDLNSRNGTYLNRQKITGSARINPGDIVQFGPGGPEFQFDISPRPLPPTRTPGQDSAQPPPATRVAGSPVNNDDRIYIKYRNGSRAQQIDEFSLNNFVELIIGRDPAAAIKYDAERDELVSARHAKIERDTNDPYQFLITDLNSRNGTFLNGTRITSTTPLTIGDVIMLGPKGPEFEFFMDAPTLPNTRHSNALPPTRDSGSLPATQVSSNLPAPVNQATPVVYTPPLPPGPAPLPAAPTANKNMLVIIGVVVIAIGVIAALLVGIIGIVGYQAKKKIDTIVGLTPDRIAELSKSVVQINLGFRITNGRGEQLYHQYFVNNNGRRPIFNGLPQVMPIYIVLKDGTVEPLLTTDSRKPNFPLSVRGGGTGFVVSKDGYILTNNHVAAGWRSTFDAFINTPSVVVYPNNEIKAFNGPPPPVFNWVPSESKQMEVRGENFQLEVIFPQTTTKIPARLVQSSDRHDVALIKIDTGSSPAPLELYDNYESVQVGEKVTVIGYPGISPKSFVVIESVNVFNKSDKVAIVPDPTVTIGNISKITRPGKTAEGEKLLTRTDDYQLTINSTGSGNSGGPMFDNSGRVTGIFYAGSTSGGASVTYSIPIRYGVELLKAVGKY